MASSYALISRIPLSRPNFIVSSKKNITISIQEFSIFNPIFSSLRFTDRYEIHGGSKLCRKYGESFNVPAFSPSNGNSPKEYKDDEFIVVNFYRFVFVENPEDEVSKHLSFMQVLLLSLFERLLFINHLSIIPHAHFSSLENLSIMPW